jgi:hypothetical protein
MEAALRRLFGGMMIGRSARPSGAIEKKINSF